MHNGDGFIFGRRSWNPIYCMATIFCCLNAEENAFFICEVFKNRILERFFEYAEFLKTSWTKDLENARFQNKNDYFSLYFIALDSNFISRNSKIFELRKNSSKLQWRAHFWCQIHGHKIFPKFKNFTVFGIKSESNLDGPNYIFILEARYMKKYFLNRGPSKPVVFTFLHELKI